MIWTTLAMAIREIRRNKMRSALTALGIIIGVAAVVSLVTLGQSASQKITSDVSKMGSNLLFIMPDFRGSSTGTVPLFKDADVDAIRRDIRTAAAVAPSVGASQLVVAGNKNRMVTVTGSTNEFLIVRGYSIERGREFNSAELQGGSACILGSTVRTELFGTRDPVGESIRVGAQGCQVVGTLASKGQSTMGPDQDDLILMPMRTVQRRLIGNTDISTILVSATSTRTTGRTRTAIESLFDQRRRIGDGQLRNYVVRDTQELANTLKTVTGALTMLLGAIAAVSLLVGGIGIMNIMLVSVTERTGEIGLRMAIGARAHEVMAQFLVESVVLSTLGGMVGLALGFLGSFLGTKAMGLPFVFVPWIAVVAFLFSAAVGVAFGFLPARKAAMLDPIEALRRE